MENIPGKEELVKEAKQFMDAYVVDHPDMIKRYKDELKSNPQRSGDIFHIRS